MHKSWPHQEGLSLQVQPRTQSRIGKNATKLADECINHECGALQTVEQQNCSSQINLRKSQTLMVRRLLILKGLGT
jgi:hypothetical protein